MAKVIIKNQDEISAMRKACRITATILDRVSDIIKPGISTEAINAFVEQQCEEFDCTSATLNYRGYPKSVCTSVNEVICHGIPSPYEILKTGDIINVDVTVIKDGFHGDSSRMYYVGDKSSCSEEAVQLIEATKEALFKGIAECAPGKHIGDIGYAIQSYIEGLGRSYGIVRDYTGHGLGRKFHEEPQVVHVGERGKGMQMKSGMTFTIEPMVNIGTYKTVLSKLDGWTVRTADNKLSAQWEHTVLITDKGVEILTLSPLGLF